MIKRYEYVFFSFSFIFVFCLRILNIIFNFFQTWIYELLVGKNWKVKNIKINDKAPPESRQRLSPDTIQPIIDPNQTTNRLHRDKITRLLKQFPMWVCELFIFDNMPTESPWIIWTNRSFWNKKFLGMNWIRCKTYIWTIYYLLCSVVCFIFSISLAIWQWVTDILKSTIPFGLLWLTFFFTPRP